MTLAQIKAAHERARLGKENCLAQMKQLADAHEKVRLDMLAHDGAMQQCALFMQEEEAAGKSVETLKDVVNGAARKPSRATASKR